MLKFCILALVIVLSCSDSTKSDKPITSEISNPIFLQMFNEYSSIIHDYHMIIESDEFGDVSDIESVTKRASLWVEKWDKEIKKADLSLNEKLELIIEYDKLYEKYKIKDISN